MQGFHLATLSLNRYTGHANGSVVASFVFKANPPPTSLKWTWSTSEDNKTTEITNDDKMTVLPLMTMEGLKFNASLVLNKLTKADEDKRFTLTAGNGLGLETYEFDLEIKGEDEINEPVTEAPTASGKSKIGLIIGLIVLGLIAVLVIIMVGVIIKRRSQINPTGPLSSMEVRNNRN